jgi:hypothetical protein
VRITAFNPFRNKWTGLAAAASLIAFSAALSITSGYGPGLDPDSLAYVGAATSFASRGKLDVPLGPWNSPEPKVPLTVWPPAFSVAMSVPQRMGIAPLTAARIILALAAAVSAATVVILFSDATPVAFALAGVIIVLLTPSFVGAHISVLSEPLFLACLTLTLFAMARERPLFAGLSAAAAVMTRYAGVLAGAAAAVWFLFFTGGPLRARIRRAILAGAPAAIAFAAWMAHNSKATVVQSSIAVSYHPEIASTLRQGVETTLTWIAPGLTPLSATLVAILVGAAIAVALFKWKRESHRQARVVPAAGVLLASYVATIVVSRMFVGGSILFDWRILAPAFLLIEIAMIAGLSRAVAASPLWVRALASGALVVWLAGSIRADTAIVEDAVEDGNDFAATEWRTSPTIEWAMRQSAERPIYTNWPPAVYFDAHRAAFDVPVDLDSETVAEFKAVLASRNGAFVAFDARNPDYPPSDSLARAAGLVQLKKFSDGAVWEAPRLSGNLPAMSGSVRK